MNKIVLEKIELANFKGFAKADKCFDRDDEVIRAENGQGKTTLRDAWFWVLGFNVSDVIPCRDNKEIPNLEISVSCEISVSDGVSDCRYVLSRTQKEIRKTNKDTGAEEKVSNESAYFIDATPFTLRTYKDKIAEIFGVPYDKLQMLCQKEFFNTDNGEKWKWSNRRKELFELCKVDELLADMLDRDCYALIAPDIRKKYSTTEIKKAVRKELAGYATEKERNAVLIADKQNEMAKYNAIDYDALETEKAELESRITDIMVSGAKKAENEEIVKLQSEKAELTANLYKVQAECAHEVGELDSKITFLTGELMSIQSKAETLKNDMKSAQSLVEKLEADIATLEASKWSGETVCPTCGQPLPAGTVEESKKRFEQDRTQKIETYGKNIDEKLAFLASGKAQLENFRETYRNLVSQKTEYEAQRKAVDVEGKTAEIKSRISVIASRISDISNMDRQANDVTEIVTPLRRRVSEINSTLGYRKIVSDFAARVEQLKENNRELTDKEMVAKTKVRQIDEYVREQVKLVTDVINGKFGNGIEFSLFTDLYAGSEHEIKEECICVFNGKTYSEMSYGERFFADFEVTKVLQNEYGVSLPVFLDNAECFTGNVSGEQQKIKLYAAKGEYLAGVKIEVIL